MVPVFESSRCVFIQLPYEYHMRYMNSNDLFYVHLEEVFYHRNQVLGRHTITPPAVKALPQPLHGLNVQLQGATSNLSNDIFYHVVINRLSGEAASGLTVSITYVTSLSTVLVDNTSESSETTVGSSADGLNAIITLQYVENRIVDNFLTDSSGIIFRFKLTAVDSSVVTGADMTLNLVEYIPYDPFKPVTMVPVSSAYIYG